VGAALSVGIIDPQADMIVIAVPQMLWFSSFDGSEFPEPDDEEEPLRHERISSSVERLQQLGAQSYLQYSWTQSQGRLKGEDFAEEQTREEGDERTVSGEASRTIQEREHAG
jgi:hypothetical protein